MSRGPGIWQRKIVERLRTREQFYLIEIVPYHTDESMHRVFYRHEQMAALRAAHRLAAQGHITIDTRRWWTNRQRWTGECWQRLGGTIVVKPGIRINRTALQIAYEVVSRLEWSRSEPPSSERGKAETKVPTLKPFQLGAVASGIKMLAAEGRSVDAVTIEVMVHGVLPQPPDCRSTRTVEDVRGLPADR
jgi:hypothetical protein